MSDTIKVLVVDDHALVCGGIRRLLCSYDDLEVVGEASTGEAALRIVAEVAPDVVLMDISMPGKGGVAATAAIQVYRPQCQVLLLTAYRAHVAAGFRAGASGYVLKEADIGVIVEAIQVVHSGRIYLQPELQAELVDGLQHGTAIRLSDREIEIMQLVAEGTSNRAIGDVLYQTAFWRTTYDG